MCVCVCVNQTFVNSFNVFFNKNQKRLNNIVKAN